MAIAADCSGEVRGARQVILILHQRRGAQEDSKGAPIRACNSDSVALPERSAPVARGRVDTSGTVRQLHAVEPHGKASVKLEGVFPKAHEMIRLFRGSANSGHTVNEARGRPGGVGWRV